MTNNAMRKWTRRGALAAGTLVVLWFSAMSTWLFLHPRDALLAFTTDAYPRVPKALAGAALRYGPYDANGTTGVGQPLLHAACAMYWMNDSSRGNALRAIRMLAAKGAQINSRVDGRTPLHEAILYYGSDGDLELIRTLLALGANPSARIARPGTREDGLSALEYAVLLGEKRRTEMLPVIELLRRADA